MRILIIEDDVVIANALKNELNKYEYEVELIEDFSDVMSDFSHFSPHLVLIDINLPHHNGYYWCAQIRAISNVPIIFISSLSEKMDQMMAMQMGADDYITKPIDLDLTATKIQALLRRTYDFKTDLTDILTFNHVALNTEKSEIEYKGEMVSLTFTELQIMKVLFKNGDNYSSRQEILDYCWQNEQYIDDNTLAVNISRLRKKLKSIHLSSFIKTKKNAGYHLVKEPKNED